MLRLAQEILLLTLNNDDGDIVASMAPQSLNTLLAGAVLMDLALETASTPTLNSSCWSMRRRWRITCSIPCWPT